MKHGPVAAELRATLAIALPLAGAQLAQVMMSFTSAAMMGRLGGAALAAGGLGNALYFMVTLMLQGVLTAVGPLAAHARGAGEGERAPAFLGQGLLIAAGLAGGGMLLVSLLPHLLAALGHAPDLVAAIARYLGAALWGMPAALGYAALRSYLSAMARTLPLMAVLVFCLLLNVVLNWSLIFGRFGMPALGVAGAGAANALVQWVQFSAVGGYVALGPLGRGVLGAMRRPRRTDIGALVRLGAPIGGIFGLESGFFTTSGVLAGLLGSAALAAHQVAMNITSINFMIPLALSQAATVRVALARGAGDWPGVRRAGIVAFACGMAVMAVTATVLFSVPGAIIGIYLDRTDPANAEAVAIALHLLFIAALFQVFDGGQAIAAAALRGLRDTAMPMVIATVGYWGVGFIAAWLLAFPFGFGAPGMWWGLALGLAAVAVPLTLRFRRLAAP